MTFLVLRIIAGAIVIFFVWFALCEGMHLETWSEKLRFTGAMFGICTFILVLCFLAIVAFAPKELTLGG